MWPFEALCDEFSVLTRLFLKLDLDPSRESLLQFFERVRKAFPRMTRFRRREDGALALEEPTADGEEQTRRSVRLDPAALKMLHLNPPDAAAAGQFVKTVLTQAPAYLSLSELDYDFMEVVFAFDLEYRGNHDELIAETLFADHPFAASLAKIGRRTLECQPFFNVALDDECETQASLEIKGRTSTYEVRTGEYQAAMLSVYLTLRRYWGQSGLPDPLAVHRELLGLGERVAVGEVVPHIIKPLAAAIAGRP